MHIETSNVECFVPVISDLAAAFERLKPNRACYGCDEIVFGLKPSRPRRTSETGAARYTATTGCRLIYRFISVLLQAECAESQPVS